jgi:uncharacterized protein YdaU (DUF1376 family)
MPLYIQDYLDDTGHLTAEQHGAYLLLIMYYWHHGSLPDDDNQLALITRCSRQRWVGASLKKTLQPFFQSGWRHKRIDRELARTELLHTKRLMASVKGGAATAARYAKSYPKTKPHGRPYGQPHGQPHGPANGPYTSQENTKPSEYDTAREAAAPPQAASDEASKRLTASPELVASLKRK